MTVSPPREFPAIRPGFPGGQSSAGLFFVTELQRRIAEQGLQFNTIPPCANWSNTMSQANDKTVRIVHEVTDADGKVLTRITAESFGFNWQDITAFQARAVRPVADAMFAMGEEFAKFEASGG